MRGKLTVVFLAAIICCVAVFAQLTQQTPRVGLWHDNVLEFAELGDGLVLENGVLSAQLATGSTDPGTSDLLPEGSLILFARDADGGLVTVKVQSGLILTRGTGTDWTLDTWGHPFVVARKVFQISTEGVSRLNYGPVGVDLSDSVAVYRDGARMIQGFDYTMDGLGAIVLNIAHPGDVVMIEWHKLRDLPQ